MQNYWFVSGKLFSPSVTLFKIVEELEKRFPDDQMQVLLTAITETLPNETSLVDKK